MDTLNQYCKKTFGEKLYKLSLNGGMTCPNRDGTLGDRGCIFCSAGGSGDFAPAADLPLEEQIAQAKARIAPKFRGSRYIAYFQAYTNTYAPVERLKALFEPVIHRTSFRWRTPPKAAKQAEAADIQPEKECIS